MVMDEVLVESRRFAAPGLDSPAFVEVIPVSEAATVTLSDLLSSALGVQVKRYGGLGSFSTVSIRGSTAEQVLVYLDGVPLNQAVGGGVDVGRLTLGGVEDIHVYRGAVPARFGGNSMGGVVHIRTRSPDGPAGVMTTASRGSFATRQLSASVRGSGGRVNYLALAQFLDSRNDFRFYDDNGTEYTSEDDEWVRRENSDFRTLRAIGRAARTWARTTLNLRSTVDVKRQGIPGIGNYQARETRLDGWTGITELELYGSRSLLGVAGGYRTTGYLLRQRDTYRDPRGEVGTGSERSRNETHSLGVRSEFNTVLVPLNSLLAWHASARRERFLPRDLLRPERPLVDSERRAAAAGVEADVPAWSGRVRINVGGQWERLIDDVGDSGYGRARSAVATVRERRRRSLVGSSLGAQVVLADGWRVKSNVAGSERAPSFFELFGDRGAVVGNAALKSESGYQWDTGIVYRARAGRQRVGRVVLAEAVFYGKQMRDLIRFIQNSQRVSRAHNIGRARIRGAEVRLQARGGLPRPGKGGDLRSGLQYRYQQAENRSPFAHESGRDLPNAPRHVVRLNGEWLWRGHRLHYEFERESRHFLDRANLRPVAARATHGSSLALRLAAFELTVEVRNISDNQIADLWGYPLPGRAYFIHLATGTPSAPRSHQKATVATRRSHRPLIGPK